MDFLLLSCAMVLAPRIETHTCCYPARASWFRRKAEFIICSVCVVQWVFGERREVGGIGWGEGVLVQSVPRKLLFPSRAPLSSICIALLSRVLLSCGATRSKRWTERARLKACRGAAHLCVSSCSSFPLSSSRWVWRGFVSNSLVHLHYHHPASQPFPPSFILSFLLFVCSFILLFFLCFVVVFILLISLLVLAFVHSFISLFAHLSCCFSHSYYCSFVLWSLFLLFIHCLSLVCSYHFVCSILKKMHIFFTCLLICLPIFSF